MSDIWTIYLQINMVKYDAEQEITITYETLWIVWSQFFTDMLIFIYIQSNLNIFGLLVFPFDLLDKWQIGIQYFSIFLVNSNSHSNFEFEGKMKFIAVTYMIGAMTFNRS